MTPKQALLHAIKVAMLLGQCRVTSNMLRLLNEQLGKIKSIANDIEEGDDETLDNRIYRIRAGWRPIIPLGARTKREAKYRLRERQALEPDGEFRIAKYIREEER